MKFIDLETCVNQFLFLAPCVGLAVRNGRPAKHSGSANGSVTRFFFEILQYVSEYKQVDGKRLSHDFFQAKDREVDRSKIKLFLGGLHRV